MQTVVLLPVQNVTVNTGRVFGKHRIILTGTVEPVVMKISLDV